MQSSILEVFEEEDYLQMNEEVKNVKELKDGICLKKKNLLKGANKKKCQYSQKTGRTPEKIQGRFNFLSALVQLHLIYTLR